MKKVMNRIIMIVVLVTLACPLPAYSTSHPLAHPSWDIIAVPDTLYIRPPGCEASFMIYVTDFYKTKPIKIWIEVSTATIMGREFPYPSGFTTQPDYTELWGGKMPDWQATVTVHASSPWELPAGDYPLKIWAYPADLSQANGTAYNVFAEVHLIVEHTGVKTCNPPPPPPPPSKCTEGKVEILQYCSDGATWKVRRVCHDGQWVMETQNCSTQPPGDWWDWWQWWRWDWWVGWWPWTTGEFDFSLHAQPASQSMKAGESTSFMTDVRLVSGIAQPVTLSLSGLPGGMSYSFSLPSANPRFTSDLRVSSQSSVSPGTYPVTIVGNGGGKTHSIIVNLVVTGVVADNKQSSSLSLSVSPPSLKVGESVALGGALSPGLTTTIELVYTRPDGFELVKHVTSSGAGVFSDAFKPDMPGPWSVKARWPGDADHYTCESQPQSFTVEPPPEQPPSIWDQIAHILPTVALVGLIVIIVLLAVVLVRRRSTSKRQAATTISIKLCGKCRTAIPEGSEYCLSCGEKL